ncbi:MAG: hypothetical protein V1824_00900, partial [archaeon]
STHYNLYPNNLEEIYIPNAYYINSNNYIGYKVIVNVTSNSPQIVSADGTAFAYIGNKNAYVPMGTYTPATTTVQTPITTSQEDCDFSLSGNSSFNLDEDESDEYKLYITNTGSKELEIDDIDIDNDPSYLDIDNDIDYPSSIDEDEKDNAILDITAESVSKDKEGNFDIVVTASCSGSNDIIKRKTINYEVYDIDSDDDDDDSSSNADCSDIDILDTSFSIKDNSTLRDTIRIVNDSSNYDYEISKVSAETDNLIDIDVIDYPSQIDSDDDDYIDLEINSEDISYSTYRNLDFEIKGKLTRSGHSDKTCNKTINLRFNVNDNSDNGYYNNYLDCSKIQIFAPAILQTENTTTNYNLAKGYFVVNNSNNKFTINNISFNDSSSNFNITKNYNSNTVYASSTTALDFDLKASEVRTSETSNATISISGNFENGQTCDYSKIKKDFKVTVYDESNDNCNKVGVTSGQLLANQDFIELFNNTNKDFFVSDVMAQDNYNLNINIIDKALTIPKNSSKNIRASVSSNASGSSNILIKGRFEGGENCDYSQTKSGYVSLISNNSNDNSFDFSGNDSCEILLGFPTVYDIVDAVHKLNLSVKNPSYRGGKILVTANGARVTPAVIYLNGNDNFNSQLTLTNFTNPSSLFYAVSLNGCPSKTYFTNLREKFPASEKISLVSFPSVVKPVNNYAILSLSVKNSYNVEKKISLKLAGLPTQFKSERVDLTLAPYETKDTSLKLTINGNVEQKVYNGKIEGYLDNSLIISQDIAIDLTSQDKDIKINATTEYKSGILSYYLVNVNLKNNSNDIKNLEITFDIPSKWTVTGTREQSLIPGEDKNISFKIIPNEKLTEDYKAEVIVKNQTSQNIVASDSILFKKQISGNDLTGFFSFKASRGTIIVILLIIVLLIVIYFIVVNKDSASAGIGGIKLFFDEDTSERRRRSLTKTNVVLPTPPSIVKKEIVSETVTTTSTSNLKPREDTLVNGTTTTTTTKTISTPSQFVPRPVATAQQPSNQKNTLVLFEKRESIDLKRLRNIIKAFNDINNQNSSMLQNLNYDDRLRFGKIISKITDDVAGSKVLNPEKFHKNLGVEELDFIDYMMKYKGFSNI